jgi:hypothetical protein
MLFSDRWRSRLAKIAKKKERKPVDRRSTINEVGFPISV